MPWYSILLAPFALIYFGITWMRNLFFDWGIVKSETGPIQTLVVGNLSVGGTGKTPMVEYLINNLSQNYSLAVLSRGYGRKTKGFLQAEANSTPESIGDEPLQIYLKFHGQIPVFVGEDRLKALQIIHSIHPQINLVILDDAFQHQKLLPHFSILLTPYDRPFFKDFLMPLGRLREARTGAKRADLIVVSKTPHVPNPNKKDAIKSSIQKIVGSKNVMYSQLDYGVPYAINSLDKFKDQPVILVSGLADDRLFQMYCGENFRVVHAFHFADHHDYSEKDGLEILRWINKQFQETPVILTTEKDSQKLKLLAKQGFLGEIPIFALPITVKFAPNEEELLLCSIREKIRIPQ